MSLATVVSNKRIHALFAKAGYELETGKDAVVRPVNGQAQPLVGSIYDFFNQEVTDQNIIAAYPQSRIVEGGGMEAVMIGIYRAED